MINGRTVEERIKYANCWQVEGDAIDRRHITWYGRTMKGVHLRRLLRNIQDGEYLILRWQENKKEKMSWGITGVDPWTQRDGTSSDWQYVPRVYGFESEEDAREWVENLAQHLGPYEWHSVIFRIQHLARLLEESNENNND